MLVAVPCVRSLGELRWCSAAITCTSSEAATNMSLSEAVRWTTSVVQSTLEVVVNPAGVVT